MHTVPRWLWIQVGGLLAWGLLCLSTGKGLGLDVFIGGPSWPELPGGMLERLTALLGLGVTLTFPGLGLALSIPSEKPLSLAWCALRTLFFSLIAFIVTLTVLKALGLPVSPLSVLTLGSVLGLGVARRFQGKAPAVAWERPSLLTLLPVGLGLGLLLALGLTHRAYMARELEDYFYDPSLLSPSEAEQPGLEARGITLGIGEGGQLLPAERRLVRYAHPGGALQLPLRTVSQTTMVLRVLWQGPVPSTASLTCTDALGQTLGTTQVTLSQAPVEDLAEGPTLRYLDRGIGLLTLSFSLSGEATCILETPQPGTLLDLSDWPENMVVEATSGQGFVLTHYYQILNIAENLAWAREVLDTRWVTLNQPPAWSYVYAALVLLVGNGLWSVNLFFLLLVVGTALLGWAAVCADEPRREEDTLEALRAALAVLPLLGMAWVHARITIESGSTNFPDHLYAFGGLACLLALLEGRTWGFAAAGTLTLCLRYPGLLIVSGLPIVLGLRGGARRRVGKDALVRLGLAVGSVCLAFLAVGAGLGLLPQWLEILHFETFPEHFHGVYDPRELLARPPEFYGTLLQYSGYTPLLLLATRSRLAVRVGVLLLAYTAVLSLIDHFPSHYFVTPLYLIGVAVSSSLRRLPGWKGWLALVACLVGLGLG